MIGYLAKMIKSRAHPEENLANRVLLSCATRAPGFTASRVRGDMRADLGDDEATDSTDPHPLVRQDAKNSMVDEKRVVWPKVNSTNAKGQIDVTEHEGAHAQLLHMLGPELCDKYRGICPSFTLRPMLSSVGKGLWTLTPKDREDRRPFSKSCSSWYTVASACVPHYTVPVRPPLAFPPLNPNLYGRIHTFVEVIVPAWKCEPFRLAKGLLYAGDNSQKYTHFHCIDERLPLASLAGVSLEYVHVHDIIATVAVTPVRKGSELLLILPIPM
jgi:hypothetical protein